MTADNVLPPMEQAPPPDASSQAPPPPAPTAPNQPAAQSSTGGSKSITVFGGVIINYPEKWGIDLRSSGSSAALTDGNGRFEVHPPNPSATTAREIADAALFLSSDCAKHITSGIINVDGGVNKGN